MKKVLLFILIAGLFSSIRISAQRGGNSILLKSGTIHSQNDFPEKIKDVVPPGEIFHGYYYRMIRFNVMPTGQEQKAMEATGILFAGYIPYNTFYTAIPAGYDLSQLTAWNARTILKITDRDKLNNELRNGDVPGHARKKSGTVDLVLQYFKTIPGDVIREELLARGYEILERFDESQLFTIRVEENNWSALVSLPFVKYL